MKVSKYNTSVYDIQGDLVLEHWEENKSTKGEKETTPNIIPLKGDNQGSIALAHNQVFYSSIKHIDI